MLRVGCSHIAFHFRKDLSVVEEGIEDHKTDTGYMKLAGIELTTLDLLRYPHAAAGIDHIATVLVDLGARLDPVKLGFLAMAFERPTIQRLGYLLDYSGHDVAARHLMRVLKNRAVTLTWVELTSQPAHVDPDLIPPVTEKDGRWHIIIRRPLEMDE